MNGDLGNVGAHVENEREEAENIRQQAGMEKKE